MMDIVAGAGWLFALLLLVEISLTLRRIDKRLLGISSSLAPPAPTVAPSKLPQFVAQDDGSGRRLHSDGEGLPFHTHFQQDGYYWQRLTGAPRGPFPTREAAKADEALRSQNRNT